MKCTLINIWMWETWFSFGKVVGDCLSGGVEEGSQMDGEGVLASPASILRPFAVSAPALANALAVIQEEQEEDERGNSARQSSFVSFPSPPSN